MYETATFCFPSSTAIATPKTVRPSLNLRLRASLSSTCNFPLASRIIVKNLGYSIGENALRKEFSSFGEIADVKLVKDEATKRSRGYAFIQYKCQDDAILALENMDCKELDGRLIYVDIAKPGKASFGGYPIASGPPKMQKQHLREADEVADCWY